LSSSKSGEGPDSGGKPESYRRLRTDAGGGVTLGIRTSAVPCMGQRSVSDGWGSPHAWHRMKC
jgi:hypothetical protein